MATKVYRQEEYELMDGSTVKVRSLSIKRLRKAMELIEQLPGLEDQMEVISLMTKVCLLVIEASNKDFLPGETEEERLEELEELLDVATIHKVIEVGSGVRLTDEEGEISPNPRTA